VSFVSVVIPTYNRAAFLPEAIASVRAQTRPPDEVVVVDDGSTDGTREIVLGLGPGIRYVYQANAGSAAARNAGIRLASGDVLAFLDSDDVWLPRHVEVLLRRLEAPARPVPGIVIGRARYVGAGSMAGREDGEERLVLQFGATLSRRAVWEEIGLLDEGMALGEDIDWLTRAREHGVTIALVDEATLLYRRHDANLTLDFEGVQQHLFLALKKSLDRRRARPAELSPIDLPISLRR
jgi:glycosyltransferase involved in cell wall biosynthesis